MFKAQKHSYGRKVTLHNKLPFHPPITVTEIISQKQHRKPSTNPNPHLVQEEPSDACPQCKTALPQTTLECGECKNTLPYCIVTGRHMLKEDWSECPHCAWPALYSVFIEFTENGKTPCPICNKVVNPAELKLIEEPNLYAKLGEAGEG